MSKDLTYRPCVGVALVNHAGDAFIGHRKRKRSGEALDVRSWQMPQGGIDDGEEPLEAAKRELWEETNVRSIELIAELPRWLKYDLPEGARGPAGAGAIADRPRNGSSFALSARIGKSTCAARPAARTTPSSTTGAGSASSVCRTLSCRSSGRSTRPSPPRSRRSRAPPASLLPARGEKVRMRGRARGRAANRLAPHPALSPQSGARGSFNRSRRRPTSPL